MTKEDYCILGNAVPRRSRWKRSLKRHSYAASDMACSHLMLSSSGDLVRLRHDTHLSLVSGFEIL